MNENIFRLCLAGVVGLPREGGCLALLCLCFSLSVVAVSVSALLAHFIFTHFLRVSSFCFSAYFLSEEGALMGIYFR